MKFIGDVILNSHTKKNEEDLSNLFQIIITMRFKTFLLMLIVLLIFYLKYLLRRFY